MRVAMVDGVRTEPAPKLPGTCPACGSATVSKCGQHVVWHWAHKSLRHCDPWWENESEWHRAWKNHFPLDWQEIVMRDERTGEAHIADVRTPAGLVIEFQRSTIDPAEVASRESFYGAMIWVIDGSKGFGDRYNFSNMRSGLDSSGIVNFHWYGRSKLFERWLTHKPLFIDFGADHGFWRILHYNPSSKEGLAGKVSIDRFAEHASSGTTDFSKNGGPATPLSRS